MVDFKLFALTLIGVAAVTTPGHAADNAMKVCGAKYQAAKNAKTLPAGQTWAQFLAQCRGAAPAKVAAAKPAPGATPGLLGRMMGSLTGTATPAAAKRRAPSGGGAAAAHQRQRQCGQEWKAAKAAGHVPAGQTWPRYWSQCNTRLKG